jgi:hypothetical protein
MSHRPAVKVSFWMSAEMYDRMKELASLNEIAYSDFMRKCIKAILLEQPYIVFRPSVKTKEDKANGRTRNRR